MSSIKPIKRFLRRSYEFCRKAFVPGVDDFLRKVDGVIHVGANLGQEAELYARHGLKVLWVEPIPEIFAQLRENIQSFPRQQAVNHLVTDQDGADCDFFVSDNAGESSSILPLGGHREMWPEVGYAGSITIKSVTLPTLLQREALDVRDYQALVLDTQGSEHLVLQGSEKIMSQFRFLKLEVPDFVSYQGCWTDAQLASYLSERDFCEMARERFGFKEGVGSYYDIVYRRRGKNVVRGKETSR